MTPANAVAIVGMVGRFPSAPDVEAFWRLLLDGGVAARRYGRDELLAAGMPAARLDDDRHVPVGYPLDGAAEFDAEFFGYSPTEAAMMDPQHRLALQACWQVLERAGYPPGGAATPTGVFLSASSSAYLEQRLPPHPPGGLASAELSRALGTDPGMLALRVSYRLNLTGPSLTVQTACSSSLVAVHLAGQSLLARECDMALAGGVAVRSLEPSGYRYEDGSILSPDGLCRPFDAAAAGTVSGDGVGVVALKRLEDALADDDHIEAVILGSAVNNDGGTKIGFTAPSSDGQAAVIDEALAVAGVTPDAVQYVEAHGTATPLGDPVEVRALTEVLARAPRTDACLLGSVKSNIGHLDAAAGIAGLIKTALALRHAVVPGTAHYRSPNPHLRLDPALLRVDADTRDWPRLPDGAPRRAGVSAFGVGGTNAHVVLQAPPERAATTPPERAATTPDVVRSRVLPLSGTGARGVLATAGRLADTLADTDAAPLDDVAYTLQRRRRPLAARTVVVAGDRAEAVRQLRSLTERDVTTAAPGAGVVLMFPGQGSQFAGMGAEPYRDEPVFRRAMDACADAFAPHLDFDVREVAFGADEQRLRQTWCTQPTVFSVGYALGQLLLAAGVEPTAMIGHSLGEYVAACLAGVFSLPDAARVVAARGALAQRVPAGRMISVALPADELAAIVEGHGTVAAVNGPQLCVLAGPDDQIAVAEKLLAKHGAHVRPLATSRAFHTAMMDPVLAEFAEVVAGVARNAPRRPFVSNVTGEPVTAQQATSADYWVAHLRQPVRFGAGLAGLLASGEPPVLVEAGPGTALTAMARLTGSGAALVPLLARDDRRPSPLAAVWRAGVDVDWAAVRERDGETPRGRVVPLPGVEFTAREHLLPRLPYGAGEDGPLDPQRWTYAPVWHRCRALPADPATATQTWLVVRDDAGLAERVAGLLRSAGHEVAIVAAGDLADAPDVGRLVGDLLGPGRLPQRVLYAGAVLDPRRSYDPVADHAQLQRRGLLGLVALVRALYETGAADGLGVVTLTDGLQDVAGTRPAHPERATIHGAVTVLPQEFPGLRCRAVDVQLPAPDAPPQWTQLAAALVDELLAVVPEEDRFVAYRDGLRWRRAFAPVELTHAEPAWRADGAYLVLGAGSEAGLMMTEHLVDLGARLVLVEQQARLSAQRRQRLTALLERAPDRLTLQDADLTDAVQVNATVGEAAVRLGRVDGVFHLVDGRVGGLVATKSPADIRAVLDARVRGTLLLGAALNRLSADGHRGFLLLGSSITGVVGGFGQLENCAVAAFLDTYAHAGDVAGWSVTATHWGQWCWDDWFERNMAELPEVRADYERQRRRYGIPVREGLRCTAAALSGGLPSVVVSTRDLRDVLAEQLRLTAAGFTAALARPAGSSDDPGWDPARLWPDDEVAQRVATVWRDVLGVSLGEPDTDFYAVGGNSLFAIQVVARLREVFGPLPMSVIFEAPTVPGLAAAIRLRQTESLADEEIASMLDEVEALTPEEIEALLAGDHG